MLHYRQKQVDKKSSYILYTGDYYDTTMKDSD
jgi:hypothetical protein